MSNPIPQNNQQLKNLYFETKRKYVFIGWIDDVRLTCRRHSEFEDGCNNLKSPDACFSLGEWHQLIAKDESKAADIYAANCTDRAHPSSCFNLAMLLISKRISVPQSLQMNESNDIVARRLLQRGCELREGAHSQACGAYATLLLSGTGGPRDVKTAITTLDKLCDAPHNDARACVRLGSAYLRGEATYPGVQKNVQKAQEKMTRACDELGHPNGCQVLAVMYSKGDGVEKNEDLAEKYRQLTRELMNKTGEKLGSVSVDPGVAS